MSVPLSLRVCCMAVMAPALTEAASQSCIKISPKSAPVTVEVSGKGGITKSISSVHLKSKPLVGPTPHITIGELKRLQQEGFKRLQQEGYIGCKEIKFQVVTNSDEIIAKDNSVLKKYQNGNHSITVTGCENMNQVNHVNGNAIADTKLKSDNKLKSNAPIGTPDEKELTESLKETKTSQENNFSVKDSEMVASSSDVVGGSLSEETSNAKETNEIKNVDNIVDLDLQEEVRNKQHVLERRTQHLLRRLRRLQSKSVEAHLHTQLRNFVEYQHKNLQTVAKSIKNSTSSNNVSDVKTEIFSSDDVKGLSTAALVNLVRRLQTTQPNLSLSQRLLNSRADNGPKGVLTIDKPTAEESIHVSGLLTNSLHHMQCSVDSDATESSSGGESCDEDEPTYKKSKSTSLHRRAEWKWASERSAVASRWTWLQAQVSDLEYRIRQQSEIYKQIRHTKGPVLLGEQPSPEDLLWRIRQNRAGQRLTPLEQKIVNLERKNEASGSPCNISKLMMNVNKQASQLTQSLGTVSPAQGSPVISGDGKSSAASQGKHLNGVIGSSHGQKNGTDSPNVGPSGDGNVTPHSSPVNHDFSCQASRCRPVRSYRKRKLLRTSGLHMINRKAARLSSVKCQCYPPITSCPMCGGRYNNVQRIDVDSYPLQEKVAILDPAFHPVLSFSQDIPLNIRFESHLKKGDWQNSSSSKSSKIITAEKRHQRYLAGKEKNRKTTTKYAKGAAAALLSSAKLRNKYERRTPTKARATPTKKSDRRLYRSELKKRRLAKKNCSSSFHGDDYRDMTPSPMSTDSDYGFLSASCPSSTLKEMKDAALKKKKMENAYDINNIVIPYSMAASTRVEKLQYKEIVTPKWRALEPEDNCDREDSCDEQIEELSDEAFLTRHQASEISERKRFSNFVQYPSRRSRSSRTDSGPATPSDPNTPSDGVETQAKDESFRRRSSSATNRRTPSVVDDKEQNPLYDTGVIEPWTERDFPLSDEDYQKMLSDQPPVVEVRKRRSSSRISLSETFGGSKDEVVDGDIPQCSPLPSSSSGSAVGEDPNDPEWSIDAADLSASKGSKR